MLVEGRAVSCNRLIVFTAPRFSMARRCAVMPALSLALSLMPAAAWAGGGAHVVDDDAVLDPGVCHSENWVTLFDDPGAPLGGRGLATVAPACTLRGLPGVELALGAQYLRDEGSAFTLTPAAKLNLRPAADGWGLAVSAAAAFDARSGRVETLALIAPVTVPVTTRLTVQGNLGWIAAPRGDDRLALFWGAQAEYAVAPGLVLMGEVFGQDRGAASGQGGLRWVTDRGRIDLDLLAGHRIDGARAASVTLGVTIRR
jgi:hypothetical protein